MPGRIAVLGARGYLGSAVVDGLVRSGARVMGVGRVLPRGWPAGAIFHLCDATDKAALQRAVGACGSVINAADGSPATMLRIAQNLAACRAAGWHGRLVHISSLSVYGQNTGVLDEACAPVPAAGHRYAQAKLAAEGVLGSGPGPGDDTVILRAGCIYGPGSPVWVDRLCCLLLAGRLGWLWDEGAGQCKVIHVDDMARTAIRALTAGIEAAGVHNLAGAEALTWNMYIRRLAVGLGMAALPRVSSMRLDFDTYLQSPAERLAARLGVPVAGPMTPAMRRLFRSQACIGSRRAPWLAAGEHTPLQVGLSQALADFRRRARGREGAAVVGVAQPQAAA